MNPLQKIEEEEELGEEEEKADEGVEEVEQEVGPPLLTPLSEDAGDSPPHLRLPAQGEMRRKGGTATLAEVISPSPSCSLITIAPLHGVTGKSPSRELRPAHGCGLLSPM